jgi:hypothetical protein
VVGGEKVYRGGGAIAVVFYLFVDNDDQPKFASAVNLEPGNAPKI